MYINKLISNLYINKLISNLYINKLISNLYVKCWADDSQFARTFAEIKHSIGEEINFYKLHFSKSKFKKAKLNPRIDFIKIRTLLMRDQTVSVWKSILIKVFSYCIKCKTTYRPYNFITWSFITPISDYNDGNSCYISSLCNLISFFCVATWLTLNCPT